MGGYLGLNLGVVEFILVLYWVFDLLYDLIIFDIGYQVYVYKMLIGCSQDFVILCKKGGLLGYLFCVESEYDWVELSYVSVVLLYVDGLVKVFELIGYCNWYVVVVVGDGVFIGGMCWEVLNNIVVFCWLVIIVVNDNGCSYVFIIGGVVDYLVMLWLQLVYEQVLEMGCDLVCVVLFVGGLWF